MNLGTRSLLIKSSIAFALLVFWCSIGLLSGQLYGELILPWYKWIIGLLETDFSISAVNLVQRGSEQMFELRLVAEQPFDFYGFSMPKGADVSGFTLVAHALAHPIILFSIVSIGSLFISIKPIRLLAGTVVALALLEAVDVPFTLLASIYGLILENVNPEALNNNLLLAWSAFLTNGGRLAISIAVGLLVLAFSYQTEETR